MVLQMLEKMLEIEVIAAGCPEQEVGQAVLDAGQLRGADAWHLACALYLSPEPRELEFLTLDGRQAAVAVALGFAGGDLVASPG